MSKIQSGYLTVESGSYLGHFSRWVLDAATGARRREQKAFVIGPLSGLTKTAAREILRARVVEELGLTADRKMTVGHFVKYRWLPLHESQWRESTAGTMRDTLRVITNRFGTVAIEDMDSVAMQGWLAEMAKTRAAGVVRQLRIYLKSIMGEAFEQDYVRKDSSRLLRVPKLRTVRKPFLSLEEVAALLRATKWFPRERTLLTVLFVAPFRPSELFGLRWGCFDSVNNTLTIRETVYKGKLRRYSKTTEEDDTERITVLLSETATLALVKWQAESPQNGPMDFIFPNPHGSFLHSGAYLRRVLMPLARMAGIEKLSFQILRRTVATHAQNLGSMKSLQAIMRHRQIETAQQHYVQIVTESVRETVEALSVKMGV